jgi:hypothetical protein
VSKAVGYVLTAALVVFAVAVPIIGPTALAAMGLTSGVITAIGAALSAAIMVNSLLMPRPSVSRNAQETTLQINEVARRAAFGTTATAGSLVDVFDYGGKYGTDNEVVIFALADHYCEGLVGVYVNDVWVPWNGDGNYPQFDEHHLSMYFRNGSEDQTLPAVVTTHGPGWTSDDNGAGICYAVVDYLADSPTAKHPAWPGGRPTFLWVVKGKRCYDPRLDDTVTGGSGPHRWDDPSTWEWSENPIVCRYNWVRGVYACDRVDQPDMLLVGRGLTATEAPPENVIAPANLCDEAAPGEFDYQLVEIGFLGFLSPDGSYMVAGGTVDSVTVYVPTLTVLRVTTRPIVCPVIAVNNDGSYYTGGNNNGSQPDHIALVQPDGSFTILDPANTFFGGVWLIGDTLYGRGNTSLVNEAGYLPATGGSVTTIDPGFFATWYAPDLGGEAWAGGSPVDGGGSFTSAMGFYRMDGGGGAAFTVASAAAGAVYFFINPDGNALAYQAGNLYVVNLVTQAIDVGPVAVGTSGNSPFRGVTAGDPWFWFGFTRYSSTDLSVLQTEDPGDWASGTPAETPTYDRINDAIWTDGDGQATVRFLAINRTKFTIGGIVAADQKYLEVEEMFAAAVAGIIIQPEGAVEIEPAQSKTPSFSFTDADILATTDVQFNQSILSRADSEWVNTVVPRYVEPKQKWQDHATPVRRVYADVIADGESREQQLALQLVTSERQAGTVGEIFRRLGRLWARAELTLGPRFAEVEEGDWGVWQSDRYLGGTSKVFRVESYGLDGKWQNRLKLREINALVYDAAVIGTVGTALPFTRTPPPPDVGAPDAGNWALTAVALTSPGGSIPALEIEGSASDDPYVSGIRFEYWKSDGAADPVADPDAVAWTQYGGIAPPSTTLVDISSISGGAAYYAAVTYIVDNEIGDRLVLGPAIVGDISTGPRRADTTLITADSTLQTADLG